MLEMVDRRLALEQHPSAHSSHAVLRCQAVCPFFEGNTLGGADRYNARRNVPVLLQGFTCAISFFASS